MLKQRIITALALLAVLLPALFADSPQPFLLLSILMIGAGAWEWGNMNGMTRRQSILSGVICVDLCIFAWWAGWTTSTEAWVWWMAGASWVVLTAWMLQRGVQGWALWHRDLRWLLGLIMLWLAWLAMAQARTASVQLLLSIFCVVWAADVFAYFANWRQRSALAKVGKVPWVVCWVSLCWLGFGCTLSNPINGQVPAFSRT
jgi:phosphatidate cytidylyltransferase